MNKSLKIMDLLFICYLLDIWGRTNNRFVILTNLFDVFCWTNNNNSCEICSKSWESEQKTLNKYFLFNFVHFICYGKWQCWTNNKLPWTDSGRRRSLAGAWRRSLAGALFFAIPLPDWEISDRAPWLSVASLISQCSFIRID